MSWAEVKKINSDMSVPLDELIKGQRSLGASDAAMAVFANHMDLYGTARRDLGTFTPKVGGTVRLILRVSGSKSSSAVLSIRRGNGNITEIVSATDETTYADLSVSTGETITVYVKNDSYSSSVSTYVDVTLGATVVDSSFLDYTLS